MLTIKQPRIEHAGDNSRLLADIIEDGQTKAVWVEVKREYGKYLCHERADAFVIGLLHYAMSHNHSICSEAPVGEYLYYQLTNYLIDAISKGSPKMHAIKISARPDCSKLPCAHGVGTGISCGIDSLHVLAALENTTLEQHKITHLTFNNVGSHGEGERAKRLFQERKEMSETFCKEYGFEFVEINSNIMDVFPQNHFITHTFTSMFAVFSLQKLYSIYYYASGRPFSAFSLADTALDCSYYDLLLAEAFSTDNLKIYSEGGTLSRLEKTRKVVNYAPSYRYLNVCTSTSHNCGKCEKCIRTLLALDVLGCLEKYREVFDIDYYLSHKQDYLKTLCIKNAQHNGTYAELYPYLRHEIGILTRLRALPGIFFDWVNSRVRNPAIRQLGKSVIKLLRK